MAPSIAGVEGTISGRLLVFMKKAGKETDGFGPEYDDPNGVWVTGIEVENLSPGKTVDFDADALSFPTPFARLRRANINSSRCSTAIIPTPTAVRAAAMFTATWSKRRCRRTRSRLR